jgi:hypothetical protein
MDPPATPTSRQQAHQPVNQSGRERAGAVNVTVTNSGARAGTYQEREAPTTSTRTQDTSVGRSVAAAPSVASPLLTSSRGGEPERDGERTGGAGGWRAAGRD